MNLVRNRLQLMRVLPEAQWPVRARRAAESGLAGEASNALSPMPNGGEPCSTAPKAGSVTAAARGNVRSPRGRILRVGKTLRNARGRASGVPARERPRRRILLVAKGTRARWKDYFAEMTNYGNAMEMDAVGASVREYRHLVASAVPLTISSDLAVIGPTPAGLIPKWVKRPTMNDNICMETIYMYGIRTRLPRHA